MTLPQSTLDQLAGIDLDRAQAIVKAVSHYGGWVPGEAAIEYVPVSPESGLVIVRACPALRAVPGLRLVEILPGRHLIVIPRGYAAEALELALGDIRETLPETPNGDRDVVDQLIDILRNARHLQKIDTGQVILVAQRE